MKKTSNKNQQVPFAVMVTDVHLDKGNSGLVKDIFRQAIALCEEVGTSCMICGGDVFTSRSGQPLECLSAWQEILGSLRENKIRLIVIPGNHDKTDGDDECSYLDVYDNSKWVSLCRNACSFWFCDDTVRVDMVPYFGTDKWLAELEKLDGEERGDLNIMVTHVAFNGVRNADGSVVGDAVPPSAVADYDLVLCGHYHDRSVVGKNIHYVGSVYQNNYGEGIVDKGFAVLYPDGTVDFVPSHFPRYIKETVAASDREALANLLDKYGDVRESEDHIRFEFVGTKSELEQLDVTDIERRYGIDCKFSSVEEREAVEIASGEEVLNWDVASVTKDFYRFCADNNIRGAELKYGIGLIKILKQ